ncbi:MAG: hypothetical protein V1706_07625 [Pseudomonadota bacterium]
MKSSSFFEKMNPAEICFGLNRHTDECSLAAFLQMFCREHLLETLIPRMADGDISDTVNFLTGIMKKHLSETEYHSLFLGEEKR